MAYMNQERKAKIAPVVKEICKKYGVKATLSVHNYSTLSLNIKSGGIDFIGDYNTEAGIRAQEITKNYVNVNVYWYREHFTGVALNFLEEVIVAMNEGNWDRSDIQVDYFDVGWYVNVNIGQWNKPYILTK